MSSKKRLGKGLEALIPDHKSKDDLSVQEVAIDEIKANPYQPRSDFDEEGLKELADSIAEHGIVQPVIISPAEDGYIMIAGERRMRAAKIVGMETIPAIIKEIENEDQVKIALVENLQREDLNPVEEAKAYNFLIEEFAFTQEKIAKALGKSRSSIANTIRLLSLPDDIKNALAAGKINMGQARSLLSIKDEKDQVEMARKIMEDKITVREVEKKVSEIKEGKKEGGKQKTFKENWTEGLHINEIKEELQEHLGTKVKISGQKQKGLIEIEFYDNEDLERLKELIMSK